MASWLVRRKCLAETSRSQLENYATAISPQKITITPAPGAFRAAMAYAQANWDGSIAAMASPNASISERLTARAYAQVYGLRFRDENDALPGRALSRMELATLPKIRRMIRAAEPDAPSAAMLATKTVASIVARQSMKAARVLGIALSILAKLPWVIIKAIGTMVLRCLAAILGSGKLQAFAAVTSIMAALFGVAFGFDTEWQIVHWIVTFPFADFQDFWKCIQIIAMAAFVMGLLMIMDHLLYRTSRPVRAPVVPYEPYGRHAISNFREPEPFGSADLSVQHEIAEALTGSVDGLTPKFED